MNCKKLTIKALTLAILAINGAFAEDVRIIGSIKHQLTLSENRAIATQNNKKTIQLLQIQLPEKEKQFLITRGQAILAEDNQISSPLSLVRESSLPSKVQLGMNKAPVLDQGIHGTCVTFAITGVIDALIGKGDYVSQLCNLQLGNYLEKKGYGPSGWDGTRAINVIDQMTQYGIVSLEKQKKTGCGGLKQYPTWSSRPRSFIEPEQFYPLSELVFGKLVNWSNVYQKRDGEKTLDEVRLALNSGDRLAIAFLIPRLDLGQVGAVGKYTTWFSYDTWVLTPEIVNGIQEAEAAHEIIITGYDDDAVVRDNNGKKHTGILKLRNSWGSSAGDSGDFYMSYDYFKLLSYDVKRFSPSPSS